jgi:hypothetical protein
VVCLRKPPPAGRKIAITPEKCEAIGNVHILSQVCLPKESSMLIGWYNAFLFLLMTGKGKCRSLCLIDAFVTYNTFVLMTINSDQQLSASKVSADRKCAFP